MDGGKVAVGSHSFESDRNVDNAGANTGGTVPAPEDAPTPHQASRSSKGSRRNKKVYKYVDLATFRPTEPPTQSANITPAEFRSQTNGLPPMAIRNSEYAPVTGLGQNMHKTFGNMFESMSQPRAKNFRKNEFAMKDDEFPSLK